MTNSTINKNPKKITSKIYPLDILIYQRVKYFTEQKDGFCYESNLSLSKQFKRSPQRISTSIQKLLKLGYLKNDGTIQQRQLKITEKILNYYFNKNDIDFNKNDIDFNKINTTTLTQILLYFNKNDIPTLTKAIRDFNKNDNRVLDIVLDFNKELNKDINIQENKKATSIIKKENKEIDEDAEFNKIEDVEEIEQRLKIKEMMKTMTMPEIHRELCRQQNEKLGIVEGKKKERTLEEVRALALKKIDEAEIELAKQRKFRQEEAKIYAIK